MGAGYGSTSLLVEIRIMKVNPFRGAEGRLTVINVLRREHAIETWRKKCDDRCSPDIICRAPSRGDFAPCVGGADVASLRRSPSGDWRKGGCLCVCCVRLRAGICGPRSSPSSSPRDRPRFRVPSLAGCPFAVGVSRWILRLRCCPTKLDRPN